MTCLSAKDASYVGAVDVLYVRLGDNKSLSVCHSVEDTPSGITVMYSADGSVVGCEVADFSERYSIPAVIKVDTKKPFELSVERADGLAVA